jgi:hypothetical protein
MQSILCTLCATRTENRQDLTLRAPRRWLRSAVRSVRFDVVETMLVLRCYWPHIQPCVCLMHSQSQRNILSMLAKTEVRNLTLYTQHARLCRQQTLILRKSKRRSQR